MSTIIEKLEAFFSKQGKVPPVHFSIRPDTIILQNDSDGCGPFIAHWGEDLGPAPTIDDGFTEGELRVLPV